MRDGPLAPAGATAPVPADAQVTVLTGVTGFLGKALLTRLLERPDGHAVLAVVRPARGRGAGARVASLLRALYPDDGLRERMASRVEVIEAELGGNGAGLPERVSAALDGRRCRIVHGAASVAFDLPYEAAEAINVGGTRAMLEVSEALWARDQLTDLAYVSTAFVAGARNGVAYEHELDLGQSFTNTYEQTKFQAERLVQAHRGKIPTTVFRPSIIAGDSLTGATTDFKMLYWPLAVLTRRLVPCIPARRDAAYDIVPIDFVAQAMLQILERCPSSGTTYHLSSGRTIGIERLLALTAEAFGMTKTPPLVPPPLFSVLVRPLLRLVLRGTARQVMLRTGSVYIPYLSRSLSFDRRNAERALEGSEIVLPDTEAYVARLLRYAARTDFGRLGAGAARSATGGGEGLDAQSLPGDAGIDLEPLDGERGA